MKDSKFCSHIIAYIVWIGLTSILTKSLSLNFIMVVLFLKNFNKFHHYLL